jgi:hypothetical protein
MKKETQNTSETFDNFTNLIYHPPNECYYEIFGTNLRSYSEVHAFICRWSNSSEDLKAMFCQLKN